MVMTTKSPLNEHKTISPKGVIFDNRERSVLSNIPLYNEWEPKEKLSLKITISQQGNIL